jgi:OOP family OmpA-OmpF porin
MCLQVPPGFAHSKAMIEIEEIDIMMLRNALLAATVLALPVAAMAQPVSGLYVAGGIGANFLMDTNVHLSGGGVTVPFGKLQNNIGLVGVGSVGYGFGNGFRGELEINGRDSHVNGKPNFGGGELITYGAMANALYDFNIGSALIPYVGAGVGYELTAPSSLGAGYYSGGNSVTLTTKNSSVGSPAAQAILGVAYPISGAPGLSVTAEYRFLATLQDTKFDGTAYVNGAKIGTGHVKLDDMYNHSLLVGLRYAFGAAPAPAAAAAPAPAAAVAPAPAPARSYLVFFDWDKANLSARAQQIIAEAAQNSTRVASTRIDVAGHADKSGTPAYNQGLSLKRANNVAAELVRLGVPRTAISISAFGDTKPLVPTAAGVREPQNRRVEIVLH